MGTIVGADRRSGRSHVPRDRLAHAAAGRRVSNRAARRACGTAASPKPRQLAAQRAERHSTSLKAGATLYKYFLEALRLQPQGEVLLRKCARDGARIADSRPIAAGTLVFASHGSAMRDVPEPDAFILDRPREHYLQYGWNRHTCLGQYVSPVIIVEIDDRAARAAGSVATRAASRASRRSRSSGASAGCSSTIRTSTRRRSPFSLPIPERRSVLACGSNRRRRGDVR